MYERFRITAVELTLCLLFAVALRDFTGVSLAWIVVVLVSHI